VCIDKDWLQQKCIVSSAAEPHHFNSATVPAPLPQHYLGVYIMILRDVLKGQSTKTVPRKSVWYMIWDVSFGSPPPPQLSLHGGQRWQPIQMGYSLHIRGRGGRAVLVFFSFVYDCRQHRHLYYGGYIWKYYLSPPPQQLLHRRAALTTNSNWTQSVLYIAERTREAVYNVRDI
jgi:hypothetical protein